MHVGWRPVALILGGALAALAGEDLWRHDRIARVSARAEPDLAKWGMHAFYGAATIEEGLGPTFNASSCRNCHDLPETGGSGGTAVLRAVLPRDAGAGMIALAAIESQCLPRLPDGATIVRRIPTPLFGAGLIDAIPDGAIAALADPDDGDGDGISGRVARVVDPATHAERVGRFGWKAQDATLLAAVGRAFAVEMGVTNRLFPVEAAGGLDAQQLAACDRRPDPEDAIREETGAATLDHLTAFVRTLEPLPSRPPAGVEREGERLFSATGCAGCHRPAIGAGPRAVRAYSDFLLHDVGTGDRVTEGAATIAEMRTAPLWGVATRRLLLHDGRALTLEAAIAAHAEEAAPARARFDALLPPQRSAVTAFLRSL